MNATPKIPTGFPLLSVPAEEKIRLCIEPVFVGMEIKAEILTILEKNQLWKLVLKKVTVYRSQDDELSIQLYPNLPK